MLTVGGTAVATYVTDPRLDIRLGPRPYLHPVRTLGGTVVTDTLCHDHPWHLGASLTVADVNGWNLWGGRTFVPGEGYVWPDAHGRIEHENWEPRDGELGETLRWCDGDGRLLLTERRRLGATAAAGGWRLTFRYALTAPPDRPVTLGSPATNGRTGGAGYGGFFWRLPPGEAVASTDAGDEPHGSAAERLTVTVDGAYTLVFSGLAGDDRWFVRTGDYNGVCAALAFTDPLVVPAGDTLRRTVTVLVSDGV